MQKSDKKTFGLTTRQVNDSRERVDRVIKQTRNSSIFKLPVRKSSSLKPQT